MTKRLVKGSRLGKYRLERRLGEGGSATVWQARDTIEGRRVAVKILSPEVIQEFGHAAVEAEARIAAQLDHPRIVGIRNADWIEGRFLIVTDLARTSLDEYSGARRSPAVALSILRDAAEAVAHAHSKGIVHRDIKPANIFIYEGRRARLGDFGTARLSAGGTRALTEAGTFGYMAPEQAYGRPRFASDVFSLCMTGYQMFSGELPSWPFEWPLEGAARFSKRCPKAVQEVLRRGLAVDFHRRWEDGIVFYRALERAIERSAKLGRPKKTSQKTVRRNRAAEPDPFALETDWFRKRFGREFEAHFDCHSCDGPIAESMSHCPWCGTTRNSFSDVTALPLVCPICERGVRAEWKSCPRCSQGRFESNGKKIPADPRAERTCTRADCRTPLRRFMRYCPNCKLKVRRPWKVENVDACGRCRWPMVSRWRFCAWCGKKNVGAMVVSVGRSKRRT